MLSSRRTPDSGDSPYRPALCSRNSRMPLMMTTTSVGMYCSRAWEAVGDSSPTHFSTFDTPLSTTTLKCCADAVCRAPSTAMGDVSMSNTTTTPSWMQQFRMRRRRPRVAMARHRMSPGTGDTRTFHLATARSAAPAASPVAARRAGCCAAR